MAIYTEKVMEHFQNPRNVGEIADASGVGTVGNAACGDIMKIYIKVEDDKIVDAKFKTFGCGAAIATSSMCTEMVKGKTIDAWYSGKHRDFGANIQAVMRPDGLPIWTSDAMPGHLHDVSCAELQDITGALC